MDDGRLADALTPDCCERRGANQLWRRAGLACKALTNDHFGFKLVCRVTPATISSARARSSSVNLRALAPHPRRARLALRDGRR